MESCCKDIEWVYRVVKRVGGKVDVPQEGGKDDQMKEVYRIRAHGHGYVHSSFSSQVASPVESAPLSFPSSSTSPPTDHDHVPHQEGTV
jgi:hypothetical protein